jgi:uncharacterized membrane protein
MATQSRERQAFRCQICGQEHRRTDVLPGSLVRESVVETIRREHPEWSPDGYICLGDLNHYRSELVRQALEAERGELSALEKDVVESVRQQEVLSRDVNAAFDRDLTPGEHLADRVAEFGGSWRFIGSFGVFLVIWMAVNSAALLWRPWDPYPFILLNLILSCIAALQAPVIMMSQNRQEEKDRLRAENDYRVNLKAELEIRNLHAKMDLLLSHQWQRLLEIQEIQTEMMEELVGRSRSG